MGDLYWTPLAREPEVTVVFRRRLTLADRELDMGVR
jgi:hypothetical protein